MITVFDVESFLTHPVWLHLKQEFEAAVEAGRDELEKIDSDYRVDFIRGGVKQLRNVISRPEDLLVELKEKQIKGEKL